MLHFSKWSVTALLFLCLSFVYLAIPTFLPHDSVLQPYLPGTAVNLGLDLRGGSSILLHVDTQAYYKEATQKVLDSITHNLSPQTKAVLINEQAVFKNVPDDTKLRDLLSQQYHIKKLTCTQEAAQNTSGLTTCTADLAGFNNTLVDDVVHQSLEIVRKRLDASATKEIDIQRQGSDNILVQVPGIYDTAALKTLLGKTAKLSFHLVDVNAMRTGRLSFGSKFLPMITHKHEHYSRDNPPAASADRSGITMIPVRIQPAMSGEVLLDAQANMNRGEYVVSFRLSSAGTRIFADITSQNIGKPLAIVLDNQIISAPNITEPIPTGSGNITGSFDLAGANELAVLLRSGALPAPLHIIEERMIGPTLGKEVIAQGTKAVLIAAVSLMICMVVFYGIWGIFTDIALLMNLLMTIAVLGTIGATLTMPGIAGIALTLGMAVDANILICERMREEYAKGFSLRKTIQQGYKSAITTIMDSNLTTIAAAAILYFFGNGPIKGFAATLTIGICCSLFTAVVLSKLLVSFWYNWIQPKKLYL